MGGIDGHLATNYPAGVCGQLLDDQPQDNTCHHVTGKHKMVTGYPETRNMIAAAGYTVREHRMATGYHVTCNKMAAADPMMRDHKMAAIYPVTC